MEMIGNGESGMLRLDYAMFHDVLLKRFDRAIHFMPRFGARQALRRTWGRVVLDEAHRDLVLQIVSSWIQLAIRRDLLSAADPGPCFPE